MDIYGLLDENRLLKQRVALLEKWIETYDRSKVIEDFLHINDLRRVGVYGYGKYGHILYEMLKKVDLEYLCVIDINPAKKNTQINFFGLDKIPDLDVIIVTPAGMDLNKIKNDLGKGGHCGFVTSLSEVLDCRNVVRI